MYTPPKEADKNAKSCLFPNQHDSLELSMDDKAYLCTGTDVGFLAIKSGKIYDVHDHEKQRKPPQHDFSTPEVHINPSSFLFMTGHQEIIDGKLHLVNDKDHTIVTVRPKYYTWQFRKYMGFRDNVSTKRASSTI